MNTEGQDMVASDPEVILVTKSCAKDLDLVVDLCVSLRSTNCMLRHVVVVDDEAIDEAGARLAEFGVELRKTSEVVPRVLRWVARRLWPTPHPSRLWRRGVRKALMVAVGPLDGWWLQQVAKLGVARLYPDAVMVSVDSDCVFLKTPVREWFVGPSGEPKLFAATPKSLQQLEWRIRTHRFLGVERYWERPDTVFTQMPQVIDSRRVLRLFDHLASRHWMPWWRTMLRNRLTEMELYGSFSAYVDAALSPPLQIEPCAWSMEVSSWDASSIDALRRRLATSGDVRFVVVQSTASNEVRQAAIELLRYPGRAVDGVEHDH